MPHAVSVGHPYQGADFYHREMPKYDGRHLWTIWAVWRIAKPESLARTSILMDAENLLTVEGPGCYHCEEHWRPDIGAHCPGEPR